jgi:FHA domain
MLVVDGGAAKRVGPNGALIGRQQDCDIVALDPSVSRRHALVRLTAVGAEVVPLGRAPVEVNGKPQIHACALHDGDRIALPGLSISVEISAKRPEASGAPAFRLERARGGSFGIVHNPFVAGGGDGDDLIVKRWPEAALALHVAQGELFVEVRTGKATKNSVELAIGVPEPLADGDALGYRKETFVVRRTAEGHARTTMIGGLAGPTRVVIEILPRGGRIVISASDGDHTLFLHERRLDLIMTLCKPPAPYKPGDLIPDDVVASIVWPRNPGVSRTEINVLIARCRKDFIEAGLAGPRLLQRAPGGGATRIQLAETAEVIVNS